MVQTVIREKTMLLYLNLIVADVAKPMRMMERKNILSVLTDYSGFVEETAMYIYKRRRRARMT